MPYLLFTIIISIGVALFAVQNAVSVVLNFFMWSFSTSLVMVILGSFFFGVLVGVLYLLMVKARHYLQDKKLKEEITRLENEKKMLEERIAMLQHTQLMNSGAANNAGANVETENKTTNTAGQV